MSDEDVVEPIQFEDRMGPSEALMWSVEKDPMLRSTINLVIVLEGELTEADLHRIFERASRMIPRLRQRVRSNPLSIAPPRWEIDPNFDLRYHLREARVPGSGSMADLLTMAAPIAMQGFDRARPLWEATVVEGLTSERTAIIFKVHHSITDGVNGVKLMLELFDLEEDAEQRPMPAEPTVHVMNQTERFIDALRHEAQRQLHGAVRAAEGGVEGLRGIVHDPAGSIIASSELASSAGRLVRPAATPLSPLMTRRSLSNQFDVLVMPLDLAKKVGHLVGGTLNDTYVTGVARGFSLYHRHHGVIAPSLRMGMPISLHDPTAELTASNAFVPVRLDLSIDVDDPIQMLESVHQVLLAARAEPANNLADPVASLLNRLPTTVLTQVFGTIVKGLDFQTSNVPGSPFPLYMRGCAVQSVFPFGPLAGGAANITLMSYQNELNIGINVDPAAVPDLDALVECFRLAFDELLDLV